MGLPLYYDPLPLVRCVISALRAQYPTQLDSAFGLEYGYDTVDDVIDFPGLGSTVFDAPPDRCLTRIVEEYFARKDPVPIQGSKYSSNSARLSEHNSIFVLRYNKSLAQVMLEADRRFQKQGSK